MGTLGGYGLSVSRSAAHPREAVALIRFLIAKEQQSKADSAHYASVAGRLYGLPQTLQVYAPSPQPAEHHSRLVSRPSNVAGHAYEDVSRAYFQSVHAVLTRERHAPMAAAALEKQLVAITGFKTGPPKTWK